jgi:hypothetical protein
MDGKDRLDNKQKWRRKMKGIGFLVSVSLLAAVTAAPLAAQSAERVAREKQLQDEFEHVQRQAERHFAEGQLAYAEALKQSVAKGGRVQPQISLGSPFWRNAEFAKMVGLTDDQKKKMEDVFQQNRLKLIDLNGSLAKEESVLSALMADLRAEEETRVLGQIDRVAQVRTELEKANARMLLGLRQVLTTEQWARLSAPTSSSEGKKAHRF